MEDLFNISPSAESMTVTCPDLLNNYWNRALHSFNDGHNQTDILLADYDGRLNQTGVKEFLNWASASAAAVTQPSILSPPGGGHHHRHQVTVAETLHKQEGDEMHRLKYYSYGIALPTICVLGIVGNVLNLVVLTRPTMRGPAYVYMRGYAGAALLAIVFALPFSSRILFHNEVGPWTSFAQAFFHAHLELFLGNACLGIGVFMLVALTVERYMAVCRLGRTRAFAVHKTPTVAACLALLAVSLYLPYLFRADVVTCYHHSSLNADETSSGLSIQDQMNHASVVYRKRENPSFAHSPVWAIYLWTLEVIFKMLPTLVIVHLNCCIIVVYRRTCARRRRMVGNKTAPPTPTPASATASAHHHSQSHLLVVPSSSNGDGHQPQHVNGNSRSSSPCTGGHPNGATSSAAATNGSQNNLQLPSTTYGTLLAPPTLVAHDGTVCFASSSNDCQQQHQICCCISNGNEDSNECVSHLARNGSTNGHHSGQPAPEDSRRFWEEKRLMFLLGSTSILFSVCITPQLVLSLMIHEAVLESYSFQVFRAVANILEVTNYSFTFYIYCLFSRDFRATLLQTLGITSRNGGPTSQTCV